MPGATGRSRAGPHHTTRLPYRGRGTDRAALRTMTAVGRNSAPRWEPRSSWELIMCSAPAQPRTPPPGVDLDKETVITGRVVDGSGHSVGGAFVRLLDSSDEFTAEVVASATGDFDSSPHRERGPSRTVTTRQGRPPSRHPVPVCTRSTSKGRVSAPR